MRLLDAARRFDRTEFQDAYSGESLFFGQLDVFDDSRRDAYGVERRILSVAPGIRMPARRVICEPGRDEAWLVGTCQPDYFNGQEIRNKYVLHRADGLAYLKTPSQALAGDEGVRAYANAAWLKDAKQQDEASTAPGMYGVFLAKPESLALDTVILLGDQTFWVRGRYGSSAEFLVAEVEDVTGSLQAVQYGVAVYDPVADSNSITPRSVQAFVLRWQALYQNTSEAALKAERGDRVVVVRKADVPAPKVGDKVVGAQPWTVRAIEGRGDVWALQVRVA